MVPERRNLETAERGYHPPAQPPDPRAHRRTRGHRETRSGKALLACSRRRGRRGRVLSQCSQQVRRADHPDRARQIDYTVCEPDGVNTQIVPYNFPINIFAGGVAPAPVAATRRSWSLFRHCGWQFCSKAGIPGGVVNVVLDYGELTGQALADHKDIGQLTFNGNVPTAQHVMETATETVTPIMLELGKGKNPVIVFPDADLKANAESISTGVPRPRGEGDPRDRKRDA